MIIQCPVRKKLVILVHFRKTTTTISTHMLPLSRERSGLDDYRQNFPSYR